MVHAIIFAHSENFKVLIICLLLISTGKYVATTSLSSRGRYYQSHYLRDHIPLSSFKAYSFGQETAATSIECAILCFRNPGCITGVYCIAQQQCVFLKSFLKSLEMYHPTSEQEKETKMIVLHASDACDPNPCLRQRSCIAVEAGFKCLCAPDERGDRCGQQLSGTSCLDIKQKYPNYELKSGNYIVSSATGTDKFRAYCDMEFDEGGWTQVTKVVSNTNKITDLKFEEIVSVANFNLDKNYVMTSAFLQTFRKFSNFKVFRFECLTSSVRRKIHIKTNSSIPSVVDYLVGEKDDLPKACHSYTRYSDDSSELTQRCLEWSAAAWGDDNINLRLAEHTMFVTGTYHWVLRNQRRFNCDGPPDQPVAVGDFWNIFVR